MIRARFVLPAFQTLRGSEVASRFGTGDVVVRAVARPADQVSHLNAELTDIVVGALRLALIVSGYRAVFAHRVDI